MRKANTASKDRPVQRTCGIRRFSYQCSGGDYVQWFHKHAHAITSIGEVVRSTALTKDVLFLGNSHTEQIAEAFLCHLDPNQIESFSATNLSTGCLQKISFGRSCDSHTDCGLYLATAELVSGVKVHVAVNHPLLFQGAEGMNRVFDLLNVQPEKIGTIVLGKWNPLRWANQFMKNYTGYPFPSIYSDCGKTSRTTALSAWSTDDITEHLSENGFKGHLILTGMIAAEGELHLTRKQPSELPYHVDSLTMFDERMACFVPSCATSAKDAGAHTCVFPGPPDLLVGDILRLMATSANL